MNFDERKIPRTRASNNKLETHETLTKQHLNMSSKLDMLKHPKTFFKLPKITTKLQRKEQHQPTNGRPLMKICCFEHLLRPIGPDHFASFQAPSRRQGARADAVVLHPTDSWDSGWRSLRGEILEDTQLWSRMGLEVPKTT